MKSSLNHIFRTIWSDALNTWVAVSELTPSKGKSRSCVLNAAALAENDSESGNIAKPNNRLRLKPLVLTLACCFSLNAQANPVGAQVVSGTASINQSGNLLTVTNTPNAIINWQGFSIGSSETTRFIQQSASSSILNRVVGPDPSSLLGTLTSNGRVFLINPAGILVGQGARINVPGFVGSTLNLSNADFLAGNLNFTTNPSAGAIQNSGTITTPEGGSVYLVAPLVTNNGIINTPKGETILAAGNTVQLVDTGTPGVSVQITGSNNTATNLGQILADSGRIGMVGAVVNNSGTISANSLVSQGGKVFLKATNRVDAGGTIAANGTTGGTIELLGNQVGVTDGATVSANGTQGGGTVLVGGDYQGKNPDIQNSQVTYVAPTATIGANATQSGDGGKLIVWSENTTRVYGSVSAIGGVNSGNGGFIETSGHYLDVTHAADASAPKGLAGTWLLDPNNITITTGIDTSISANSTAGLTSYSSTNDSSILTVTTIQTALNAGTNVNVTTAALGTNAQLGDIIVSAAIAKTAGAAATLTLNASNNIVINAPITSTVGALSLTLNYGSAGSATLASTLGLLGGALNVQKAGIAGVGTLISNYGTLDSVILGSNLTINGSMYINNTLTLANGVTVNKDSGSWYFNTANVQHIAVQSGTATLNDAGGALYASYTTGGSLQIDSGVTLQGYGGVYDYNTTTGLINNGSIIANTAGQIFYISDSYATSTVTNNGTMSVTAGTLTINPITFTNTSGANVTASAGTTLNLTPNTLNNAGTITLGGTTATLGAYYYNSGSASYTYTGLTNTGSIALNSGTLNLNISSTTAGLNTNLGSMFTSRAAGTALNFGGTLTNTGSTLDIGSAGLFGSGGLNGFSGVITGGTIVSSDATHTLTSSSGTLDGVTLGDATHLAMNLNGYLYINNTLTLANGVTVNKDSGSWYFNTANVQHIAVQSGTATLNDAGGALYASYTTGGSLQIDSGVTLQGYGGVYDYNTTTGLINNGSIIANTAGQIFYISDSYATSTVTNNGTMSVTAGTLTINPITFTNTSGANVTASAGTTLNLTPNTLNNAGTITLGGTTATLGAYYYNSGSASYTYTGLTNTGSIALNSGTLNLNISSTTAGLNTNLGSMFTSRAAGTALNFGGTLTNTGSTLDIGSAGLFGSGGLNGFSGVITGGTIVSSDATHTLTSSSGTLDGVTLGDATHLAMNLNGYLYINNTLTLANGVTVNKDSGSWYFNTANVQHIAVQSGTATLNDAGGALYASYTTGGSLQIDSGVTLQGYGGVYDYNTTTGLINNGSIIANTAGQIFYISDSYATSTVTNNGTMSVTAGTLTINPITFTNTSGANVTASAGTTLNLTPNTLNNAGTITLGGTTATLGAYYYNSGSASYTYTGLTNTGSIALNSGTLNLNISSTTAGLNTNLGSMFTSRAAGTALNFGGTLTNTGSTLDIGSAGLFGSGGLNGFSGVITGGTIVSSDATHTLTSSSGTLDGVTLGDATHLALNLNGNLFINNGITLGNGVTVNKDSGTWYFGVTGLQHIATTGTATLNDAGGYLYAGYTSGGSLQIDSGVTLQGYGTIYDYYTSALTNAGMINGNFSVSTANFTNNGTLAGTGTITVGGGSGTLTNNGVISPGITGGNTTGTLSINGNLAMGSSSSLNIEIDSPLTGDYSVLNVSGTATLTGSALNLSGWSGSGSYAIVNATGGLGSTTFAPINSGTFTQTPTYSTNSLTLAVTANTNPMIYWTGGASTSDWATAANWSNNTVPISTENLYIGSGAGTVTVSTASQAGSTLTCNATFNLSSSGALALAGVSTFKGVTNISGGFLSATGAITIGTGGTLNWTGGTISASLITQSGSTSTVTGGTFTYSTWNNSGTLNLTPAAWTNFGSTLSQTAGILNLNGTFTATNLGFLTRTGGTVNLIGTLTNTGTTLDIGSAGTFGTGGLNGLSGTITGGTIISSDTTHTLTSSSGTLDGVTLGDATHLALNLNGNLFINNGITLGNGVTVNKDSGTWYFGVTGLQHIATTGTATLNDAGGYLYAGYTSGGSLQIDSGVTLQGYGSISNYNTSALTNNGSIIANTAGQPFTLSPTTITNNGTMSTTAGTLTINPTTFTNATSAAVTASAGTTLNITPNTLNNAGTFTLGGTTATIGAYYYNTGSASYTYTGLTNTGSIAFSSGTLNLDISGTTAGLNTNLGSMFSTRAAGTTLNFGGALTNTGTTLDIGSAGTFGTGGLNGLSGTITGGTIISSDTTHTLTSSSGTLDGVTLGDATHLALNLNGNLFINNGITLGNGVTVNKDSGTWYFGVTGLQHIATTGTATLNDAGGYLYAGYTSGGSLQIDSGVTLQGYGSISNYNTSALTNNGSIIANTAGQPFTLSPTTITNNGTMSTTAGTLTINPTTFTNATSAAVTASAGTTLNITPNTLNNAGTFTLGGTTATIGAYYYNTGSASYTYTGLTNTGSIAFSSGTLNLDISGTTAGLNTNLGSMFSTRAAGTTLNFGGALTNTGTTLDIGSAGTFGTGGLNGLSGTITGGTIISSDTTHTLTSSSGTLDGVTLGDATHLALNLNGNLFINNGITLGNGVTVNKDSGTWYFGVTGLQHIATTGTATLNDAGGYLYAGYTSGGSLQIDSGVTLQGYGSISNYNTSALTNNGSIIANTAGQPFTLSPTTITNNGTMSTTAGTLTINPTTFTNATSAAVTASAGTTLNITPNTLNNAGTFTLGGTTATIGAYYYNTGSASYTYTGLTNTGSIAFSSGTLNLDISGTTAGLNTNLGSMFSTRAAGTTLNFGGALTNTGTTLDIGSAGTFGTGGLNGLSGTITGGTIISSDTTHTLTSSSGTLDGVTLGDATHLALNLNGNLFINNGITLGNGVTVNKDSGTWYFGVTGLQHIATTGTATLNDAGGYLYAGYTSGGSLQIDSGVTLQGYGSISNYNTSALTNNGSIIANTAGQPFTLSPTTITNNGTLCATSGTLNVSATNFTQSGTINLASGGTFTRYAGFTNSSTGVIQGSGFLNLSTTGTLTNQGAINPGGAGIGQLNIIGNLTNTGTINIDIGGLVPSTQHDKLMVSGTATLGGMLNVNNVTAYTPGATDAFNVLGAGTVSGTFATINTPTGSAYTTQYNTKLAWLSLSSIASPSTINAWLLDGNGDWNVAANWTNQAVPTASDTVVINRPSGVYNVAVSNGTLLAGSLQSNENLLISGGSLTVSGASTLNGNTVVTGGTVNLNGGATNNSMLSGTGTINVGTSGLNNLGTINPGNAGAAGKLSVTGNVVLGTSSILNIRLGGTGTGQSDALAVTGNVTMGGTLNATQLSSYSPVNADAIPFITMGGTASGTFATTNLPTGFSAGYRQATGEAARLIYASGGITDIFTNGSGTLDWDTAGNWSSGVLPGAADSALITTGPGYAVTHATNITDTIATLTISSGNSLKVSAGSLTVSGITTLGGGLTVSGGSAMLNGALNGATSGLVTVSGGSLTVFGASTLNGSTVVTGGTVNLNGGATNNGTLSGTGTINVGTSGLNNLGTINPGNAGAVGKLSVTGNVVLGTSSILNIRLGGTGTGQSDALAVTGNVTMGGTLNATQLGSYTPVNADTIPFITMTGTSSGSFSSPTLPIGFTAGYPGVGGVAASLIYSFMGTDTFTNGSHTYDWDTAGNWSAGVPGSANLALIGNGFAVTHSNTLASDTVAALTINSGNSLNVSGGSLTVLSGTTLVGTTLGDGLTVSGAGIVALNGALSGSGQVSVSGGTLTLGAASTMNSLSLTGGTLNGAGSLTVTNSYNQTAGVLGSNFASIDITQATGNLTVGSMGATGTVNLTATTGSLVISDAQVTSGGNMTVNVGGNLNLTATTSQALLQSGGTQTINFTGTGVVAHQLNVQGGNNSSYSGASASIQSTGLQTISYDNTSGSSTLAILVAGGSAVNNNQNAYVYTNGVQGALVCTACATYNEAHIQSDGGQTISASTITVDGGVGASNAVAGNGNKANIHNTSTSVAQNITTTGAISLTGGTAPGFFNPTYPNDSVGNGAEIHSDGMQVIHAGSIALSGGGDTSTLGGALLGGNAGQNITTTGNLSITGGLSNVAGQYGVGAPAVIGDSIGASIILNVGGSLSMTGGSGSGSTSPALIGSALGAPVINITAANISMNQGTGGAPSGIGVLTGGPAGSLSMTATTGGITEDAASGINTASLFTSSTSGATLNGINQFSSFSAGGTGAVSLTDTTATLALGAINSAGLTVNNTGAIAVNGAITEGSGNVGLSATSTISEALSTGNIATTGTLTTSSSGGTTLNGANTVGTFNANNTTSGNIALTNTSTPLTIAGISNIWIGGGNISVDNTGATTTTGAVNASGAVAITAHSPLTIGSGGVSAGGNIALTAGTSSTGGILTLNGLVSTTGTGATISLIAGNTLAQNANVSNTSTGGGSITANAATGGINMAPVAVTSSNGGTLSYSAGGNVVLSQLNAGSGAINLTAGGNVSAVPGATGLNLIGGTAALTAGGNANFSAQVQTLITTGVLGSYTITDASGAVLFSGSGSPPAVVQQLVTTVLPQTSNPSGNLPGTSIISLVTNNVLVGGTADSSLLNLLYAPGSTIGGTAGSFGGNDNTGSAGGGTSSGGTGTSNLGGAIDNSKGKKNAKPNKC